MNGESEQDKRQGCLSALKDIAERINGKSGRELFQFFEVHPDVREILIRFLMTAVADFANFVRRCKGDVDAALAYYLLGCILIGAELRSRKFI